MSIAPTGTTFERLRRDLPHIQDALREAGLDGWLLYDLHARNSVTARLTGLGDLTRRYFVLIPAEGEPTAVIHGIEETPWEKWPWQRQSYVGWRKLNEVLQGLLSGRNKVAMEIAERDAVPAMDLVPWGVVELIRSFGPEVVASGNLVSRFYASWSDEDYRSHMRSSAILAQVAHATFTRIARDVAAGVEVTEGMATQWVLEDLKERGAGVGADTIVGGTLGAADPHYSPVGAGARLKAGDLVLIDLWAKESEQTVFADQTWMAYLGPKVPERAAELFSIIRDGRDAAVQFLQDAWQAGRPVRGGEVDDVCRGVIEKRGYGHAFIHRTGHSIDQSTHGMGPNIDNLETNEIRLIVPGVAFSIEPGIYLPGDIGMRTEINVFVGANGPEVTTPNPQSEILALGNV